MDYSEKPPLSIVQSLVLGGSAAAWYLLQTSVALAERGHRIAVISPPGGTAEGAARAGLEVRTDIDLNTRNPLRLAGAVRSLRTYLDSGDFDMVMAHWGADHFACGLALRGTKPDRRPLLVRVRSHDHRPPKVNPLTAVLYNRWTDAALVSARFQLPPFRDGFRYPAERLALVGPGIDPDCYREVTRGAYRARLDIGDGAVLVGLLARLTPIKGHEIFLRAAKELCGRYPNVRFVVSGPSLQMTLEDIKRIADRFGLGDRLHIIGPADDVRRLIADLDIGVVSSLGSEAISRIAMEYMASGVPVVASRVGGIPELIEDGAGGVLVKPGDASGLARALAELIDNPDERARMGAAGRARIETHYRLSDQIDKLEACLYRLRELGRRS